MKITILTLFPEMFDGPFKESIVKHAQEKEIVEIKLVDIRDFGEGKHKMVDDRPYGGGVGMVMKVDVIDKALKAVMDPNLAKDEQKAVFLDPRGKVYKQAIAREFSTLKHLILLCGHYEGIDERIRELVDETISLGDYVVTGGEIPAMMITDSVVRLLPGVLKGEATEYESFTQNLLEYPQYTAPRDYEGMSVPEVLLSGNHKQIESWRKEKAAELTKKHRPDLG